MLQSVVGQLKSNLKIATTSILLLTISFATFAVSATSETDLNIHNTGVINYALSSNPTWVPSDALLLLEADFENTVIINPDDDDWNGKFSDWTEQGVTQGIARANAMSIVNDPTGANNRVLKVVYGGNTGVGAPVEDYPNRPNVVAYIPKLEVGDEYWFSMWYYFPKDFKVINWYTFGAGFSGYSQTAKDLSVTKGHTTSCGYVVSGSLDVYVDATHALPPDYYTIVKPYCERIGTLPLGRWFNVRFHVRILPNDEGTIEWWFDNPDPKAPPQRSYTGLLIVDPPSDVSYFVTVANHYSAIGNDVFPQYSDDGMIWKR
jgi:hypothetical protein